MSTVPALPEPQRSFLPAAGIVMAAAGGLLLAFMAVATGQGMGVVALALVVCALLGSLIVVRPEFGAIALTSTFFIPYPGFVEGYGAIALTLALGMILGGILMIRVLIERRAEFLRAREIHLVFLILALALINAALSDDVPAFAHLKVLDLTMRRILDTIKDVVFVVFVVAFLRQRWHLLLFAGTIVMFVMITAPSAIYHALSAQGHIEQVRASADFGISAARNANRLAFVCGIGIALVSFAAAATRSWKPKIIGAVIVMILIATIVLSASRSGLINLIVIGLFLGARLRIRPLRVAAITIFVISLLSAGLLLAPASVIETIAGQQHGVIVAGDKHASSHGGLIEKYVSRLVAFVNTDETDAGASGSTKARLELLALGARIAWDHPLMGIGFGNFRWKSILEYQNPHLSAIHNSYAITIVEGGLVLLLPYFALFVTMWFTLRRTRRMVDLRPDVGLDWLVDATRTMFVMFLIFSVFAEMWHEVYLYVVLALTLILAHLYGADRPATRLTEATA